MMFKRFSHWPILFILLFATLWRLPQLAGSFWLDEAAQALESVRPLAQQLNIPDDFQPPLLHLLVHFEMGISHQEWWLRTGAALIPGLLTIWGVYLVGSQLQNRRVGLLAAGLLATSSFHVFYSQELRPYALPAMLAVFSWLMILKLMQTPTLGISREKWFAFGLLSLAGIYTSYLYPFLLITQFLYLWLRLPKSRLTLLATGAGICAFFLPWLPSFLNQLHAGQALRVNLPGWQAVVSFDQVKSLLIIIGKFVFGVLSVQGKIFVVMTLMLVAALAALGWSFFVKQRRSSAEWQTPMLLITWFALPIFLAWLVSFAVPVLQPKRVLYCLPAFYLGIAWLVDHHWQKMLAKSWQILAGGVFVGLLTVNLFSSYRYFTVPRYQREDWRSLHAQIVANYGGKGAVAAFAFPGPFAPWNWYDDGHFATFATSELTTEAAPEIPNAKALTQYRYVLVFEYLQELTDPQHKVTKQLQSFGYHEVDHLTPATPVGVVRVYARPESVIGLVKED